MDEELVANRLTGLRARIKELRTRRDDLTADLDHGPAAPDPAALAEVADHIGDVIAEGNHNQTKALIEALVARVTITGPNQLKPVFRIPQPRSDEGAAGQPAETAPKGTVRTMPTSVVLSCQHTNRDVLVEGPEITIRPAGTRRVADESPEDMVR